MLVAITQSNEQIVLSSSIPRETLLQLKKTTQFFCPQCKESLLLKIGDIKIPHFAHYSKGNCECRFSEGESELHLLGKEKLFYFFKAKELPVQLEPYLTDIQQRPDLLVTLNEIRYAIEFQCSPLSKKRFVERNKGYTRRNIQSIWIPISPQQRVGINPIHKISLPRNLQKFIIQRKSQRFLMTFDPRNNQFVYYTNLLHVYGNTFLSKIVTLPTAQQQFPFYFPKDLKRNEFIGYLKTYNQLKKKYLPKRILISRKGVRDIFLRSLYELSFTWDTLPTFIGIPIRGNESISLFSVEWQLLLFYYMHIHGRKLDTMSRKNIILFLKWMKVPLTENAIFAIQTYCKILNKLKITSIHSPISTIQLYQLMDELFMQFLAFDGET